MIEDKHKRLKILVATLNSIYEEISNASDSSKSLSCDGWVKNYNEIILKIRREISGDNELETLLDEDFKSIELSHSELERPNRWSQGIQTANLVKSKIRELSHYFTDFEKSKPSNTANSELPMQLTQNIISNSTGTIIGHGNTQTIIIYNDFNSIYRELEHKNPPNKEDIVHAVKTIEDELIKESSNKSVIRKAVDFLKENASWIIPSIIELIKKPLGL